MKNLIYLIEYLIITFLFAFFKLIGFKNSSNMGYLLGKYFGPFFRPKNLIIKNLSNINIKFEEDSKTIASEVLGNYGRIFAEYPFLKDFRNDRLKHYIEIEGLEHLDPIIKNKKRVVFVSGHFNNFELMAMQLEKAGINLAAIYRPLNNIFLNKVMVNIREKFICKKQIKKGRSGSREIIENLKKGKSIALMIDQRVREGIKVDFFGKKSTTTTIPEQLIKKYNCEVVPIYIERKNNYFFKMYISQPINLIKKVKEGEITEHLNKILEKMIIKNPNQWIWTHDRWKE